MNKSRFGITSSIAINIFILFILILFSSTPLFSNENSKGKFNNNHESENILYQFMRDNYRLESYAAGVGLKINEEDDSVLKELPMRDLFHKLKKKLMILAIEENKSAAISQESITREMQKVMAQLILGTDIGFDLTLLLFREKFKKYPNTADLVTLAALSIHDAKDTYELLNGIDKNTPQEPNTEIMEIVFRDAVDGYHHFIEKNKETLTLIEQFANNDFQIKNAQENCLQFFGLKHCRTKIDNKTLKNFSEIMPHIENLQNAKHSTNDQEAS